MAEFGPRCVKEIIFSALRPAVYLRNMEQIVQQIEQYKQEMLAFEAQTPEQVEAFRIKYLGTKG